MRATLQAAGIPIGALDTLIAAHALALGVTLVSNNPREFNPVPGLALDNWVLPRGYPAAWGFVARAMFAAPLPAPTLS